MRTALVALALVAASGAAAQQTIDLAAAYELAAENDPRVSQLQLEAQQSDLRLKNIAIERRPSFSLQGSAQVQSEVVEFPAFAGSGPKEDSYDASLYVDQTLFDPSREARIGGERARLLEAQARVQVARYALRQEVAEAYFSAALLQEREAQVAHSIADLEARLDEATMRVDSGTALPSEAAAIEATLLQRRADVSELAANRRAALERLGMLTGRRFSPDDRLAIPVLDGIFAEARARVDAAGGRPEFAQLLAARKQLDAQKELSRAGRRPRFSAFGRVGYGRPGFDLLSDELHSYGQIGVRLQWKPFDWGESARDQEIAGLQQASLQADEETLARTIDRAIQNDVATVDRLHGARAIDERIVALRELIEKETRARLAEGVVTAADYVDKETDVLDARLLLATHRVELAQAQARALNTLGVEIR